MHHLAHPPSQAIDWPSTQSSTAPRHDRLPALPGLPSPLEPHFDNPSWIPQRRSAFDPLSIGNPDSKPQQLPSLSSLLTPPLSEPLRPSLSFQGPPILHHDTPASTASPPRPPYLPSISRHQSSDPHGNPLPGRRPESDYHLHKSHSTEYFHPQPQRSHATSTQLQRPSSRASALSGRSERASPVIPHSISEEPSIKRRPDQALRAPNRVSRCVGKQHVEGEGLCYIYEDGTYCPTIIEGEAVNPSWGITKAGKPRKRLAQACLTCREKKIKCDPAVPKCHQCAKSQRVCRGGLNETIQAVPKDESYRSETASPLKRANGTIHSSPTYLPANGGPVNNHNNDWERPAKIRRLSREDLPARSIHEPTPPQYQERWQSSSTPTSAHGGYSSGIFLGRAHFNNENISPIGGPGAQLADQLSLCLETDPYDADARLTLSLLELFFTHISSSTYCIFPRDKFIHWVQTNKTKSSEDRMVLYSVLALGANFSSNHEQRSLGKQLHGIAAHALYQRYGKFSLQLCHARLLVGLYCFARGRAAESWDHCGMALRCISALMLNSEEGIQDLPDDTDKDYGFDRHTLLECRRRTFWSGFLMDRFNAFCGGTMCQLNVADTFLRLPCLEQEYDGTRSFNPPHFDYDSFETSPEYPLGAMAHLVQISAIWGDVFSTTTRFINRFDSSPHARVDYEPFYENINRRLKIWIDRLPNAYRYSQQNLDKSIVDGSAGTFISLHALYHTTIIRLNRHVRVSRLESHQLHRNITATLTSSYQLLEMSHALSKPSRDGRLGPNTFTFTTPFPGFAYMTAIDVLTAAGPVSSLPNLKGAIQRGLVAVEELSESWASARAQSKAIAKRLSKLEEIESSTSTSSPRSFATATWRLEQPLETAFKQQDDTLYGAGDMVIACVQEARLGY